MIRRVFLETAWWSGLSSGQISVLIFIIEYKNGINQRHSFFTFLAISVPVIMILFSIAYRKHKINGGYIGTGEGVITGLLTAIIGTNIASFALYSFLSFDHNILTNYIGHMTADIVSQKAGITKNFGAKAFTDMVNDLSKTTVTYLVLDYFIKSAAVQFIFALLAAAFFRKKA